MRNHLVHVKAPVGPPTLRCDPRAIYSPIGKRTGRDFERLIPPRIGGLGGQNHSYNQQRLNS
ncbi:hypothetical protein BJP34_14785 [Moorena producens PAL-8-15-08-1]|uniref:Uncharacterized protein n=1 Tax=Moorena producens PAL-8-15-08-1 TaxID=1458985 RepID=A0A1D8TSB3_9CYAN|nr:hypothetical protein BJP34_14785 [Moorena producens PAL-8-15-08-1]